MGYDIFISYCAQDKLFVETLARSLEQAHYRCWYAPRDLPAGVSRSTAISQAVQSSKLMILVFSAAANNSEEIRRELALSSKNKLPVMPVRMENISPWPELRNCLAADHWLDIYDLAAEKAVKRIIDGLERYDSLFPERDRNMHPDMPPLMALAKPEEKNKKYLLRRILIVVILLLLFGGVTLYSGLDRFEPDPQSMSLAPAQNAEVHQYAGPGGQSIKAVCLKLAPLPNAGPVDEYLVAIAGVGGPMDGRVFRCQRITSGQQMRFIASVKGREQVLLSVDSSGHGSAYRPDTGQAYPVSQAGSDNTADNAAQLLELYRKGQKWLPHGGEAFF